jgi:hypothetical protein
MWMSEHDKLVIVDSLRAHFNVPGPQHTLTAPAYDVVRFIVEQIPDQAVDPAPNHQQELVQSMRTRAAIRRKIRTKEGDFEPDRIADMLDRAADEIVSLAKLLGA